MDFVVVGFGVGTLGVLLGVVLLGWLAGRSERAATNAAAPAAAAYAQAAAAEYRGAGQAFIYAGGAVILATIGGLAGALDDRTGALLVATTATVAVLGIFFWGYLYWSRHPLPTRPRRQPRSTATSGATSAALLDRGMAPSHASDEAIAPAPAIAPPDATDPGSDSVPAMALNGEHDVAGNAPANHAENGSAIARASERQIAPEIDPESFAPNPDEPPPGGTSVAAAQREEFELPANNHATGDATIGQDAKMAASVAPGARASESRAPISGDDEVGSELRKP